MMHLEGMWHKKRVATRVAVRGERGLTLIFSFSSGYVIYVARRDTQGRSFGSDRKGSDRSYWRDDLA